MMRRHFLMQLVCLLVCCNLPMFAQREQSYGDLMTPQLRSDRVGAPEHLRSYIVEGKLRLGLRDAGVLTLENTSQVQVQQTQVGSSKFNLLGAHSPFDPTLTSSYNLNDTTAPPVSLLQGTGGLNVAFKSTTQFAQFNYAQTFETGTNVQALVTSTNSFSNNSLYFFN